MTEGNASKDGQRKMSKKDLFGHVRNRLQAFIGDDQSGDLPVQTRTGPLITRRSFLAASSLATLGFAADRSKFATYTRAFLSRPPGPKEKPKEDRSKITVLKIWEKHFKSRESSFPYQVWLRMANNLYRLAELYYGKEYKQGESPDSYFERFMDEFVTAADIAGIDPVLAVITFQVSGENNGFKPYKHDRKVGMVQLTTGWLGRATDQQAYVDNLLAYQPEDKKPSIMHRVVREAATKVKIEGPGLPISVFDTPRLSGPVTTGIHDIESVLLARSIIGTNDQKLHGLSQQLTASHPRVLEACQKVYTAYGTLDTKRQALIKELEEEERYVDPLLDDFFDLEKRDRAFTEIGINKEYIDKWHRTNYSIPWVFLVNSPDWTAYEQTLGYYHPDLEVAYDGLAIENRLRVLRKRLLLDEIRNPSFISYLYKKATTQEQRKALTMINAQLDEFKASETKALQADASYVAEAGPYELDSKLQLAMGMAYMKSLQNLVEKSGSPPLNPQSNQSLAWTAFQMLTVREIIPIFYLTPYRREDQLFIRSKADPPTHDDFVLQKLHEAVDLATREGILPAQPVDNIYPLTWLLNVYDHYWEHPEYLSDEINPERIELIRRYFGAGIMKGHYSSMDRAIPTVSNYLGGFEGDIRIPLTLKDAREMCSKKIIRAATPNEIYKELERMKNDSYSGYCEFILAPGITYEFTKPVVLPPNVNFIFNGSPDTKIYFPSGVKSGFVFPDGCSGDFSFYIANIGKITAVDDFTLIDGRNIDEGSRPNFVVHEINFQGSPIRKSTIISARNIQDVRIMYSNLRADRIIDAAGELNHVTTYLSDFSFIRKDVYQAGSCAILGNAAGSKIKKDVNILSVFTSYDGYYEPFHLPNGLITFEGGALKGVRNIGQAKRMEVIWSELDGFPAFDLEAVPIMIMYGLKLHFTDFNSVTAFLHDLDAYENTYKDIGVGTIFLPKLAVASLSQQEKDLITSHGFQVETETK